MLYFYYFVKFITLNIFFKTFYKKKKSHRKNLLYDYNIEKSITCSFINYMITNKKIFKNYISKIKTE